MRFTKRVRRAALYCALALTSTGVAAAWAGVQSKTEQKKPELILRGTPAVAFAPAKVQFTALLQGGDNDYQDYYCPGIEWDWDDDTVSESTPDCDPYEPGRSRIARRYSATHLFQFEGAYEVRFKLKQHNKVLAVVTTKIEVRPGMD